MSLSMGCIADDLTGATDLGVTLAREGLAVIQVNGMPPPELALDDADAIVIALKSRTIPAPEAVERSLAALRWLRQRHAERIYFKYCSTFDSTSKGNIGPVTEALQSALNVGIVPTTPAYPRNGRTVYLGHLFVNDVLLSASGMRDHPLTPMTDANLVRVMTAQSTGAVGVARFADVAAGPQRLRERLDALAAAGCRHAIIDAVDDSHLFVAGESFRDYPLAAGGAGLAMGIAHALLKQNDGRSSAWVAPPSGTRVAWLSGSCSDATRAQLAEVLDQVPAFRIDPLALAGDPSLVRRIAADALAASASGPILVYATADPEQVLAAQTVLGAQRAATIVEETFRRIARVLADGGIAAFVVAGGETSGAVAEELHIQALAIGPEIDPGVPWTRALGGEPLWFALKSGNFGARDFFRKATAALT